MRIDKLKQYVSLRQDLLDEKSRIESRLDEITAALAAQGGAGTTAKRTRIARRGRRRSFKRAKNEMSLKEAVLRVTKSRPLTKAEILSAVRKTGYKFTAKAPLNSLNTLLYGSKNFKNHGGGKFGPA